MADTNLVLDITSYISNISYTFSYDTVINVDFAGFEYRYPKLFSHRLSINISDYVFQGAYGAKCSGYSKEAFLSFFDSVRGCQDTFLVRCLVDYQVKRPSTDGLYNLSSGRVFSDGLMQQINTYDLNEYKFIKNYHHDGVNGYKTIYDLDSVPKIYSQNGTLIPPSQYSVVCTLIGGCRLIRNNTMPIATIPSFFEGTYLYRVRFANPTIDIEQTSGDLFRISNFELVSEVQPEQWVLYPLDFPRDVTNTTRNFLLKGELANSPNTSVFPRSATEGKPMQTFTYGWRNENVEANSTGLKAVSSRSRESLVSVPSKTINTLESKLLLTQFLANKGRLLMFNYRYGNLFGNTSAKARFDTDSLTFNMRYLNETDGQDCEGLYEVNNLSFKTYPNTVATYTFNQPFNPEAPPVCAPDSYPTPSLLLVQNTLVSTSPNYRLKSYCSSRFFFYNANTGGAVISRCRFYAASYTSGQINIILQERNAQNQPTNTYVHYRVAMTTSTPNLVYQSQGSISSYSSLNLTLATVGDFTSAQGDSVKDLGLPSTTCSYKRVGTTVDVPVNTTMSAPNSLALGIATFESPHGITFVQNTSSGSNGNPINTPWLMIGVFQAKCS